MKCKNHPYERGVGVCASCLRDRLLALIASQNELPSEYCPNFDPPNLLFPRSVSPYVFHRRSVGSGASPAYFHHRHRFFSTPQVGPAAAERNGSRKFSLLSTLFGYPRSDLSDRDSRISKASGSSSWLWSLIAGRRKKKSRSERGLRSRRASDRGLSPAKQYDEGNDSPCSSGYSTESYSGWRRPEPTPIRRVEPPPPRNGGVSSLAMCLSPLVRPSPNGRRGPPAAVSGRNRSRSTVAVAHRPV